jgi:hypothetical protein
MKGVIILACVALLACADTRQPIPYPPTSYMPPRFLGEAGELQLRPLERDVNRNGERIGALMDDGNGGTKFQDTDLNYYEASLSHR